MKSAVMAAAFLALLTACGSSQAPCGPGQAPSNGSSNGSDGGGPEGGAPDGGLFDSGAPDGGSHDAGGHDAGTPDAGRVDVGVSGAVILIDIYDATVSFAMAQATAAFFPPQETSVRDVASGSCNVYSGLVFSWFGVTPSPTLTRSVGTSMALTSGSASLTLGEASGQYATSGTDMGGLPLGVFQASYPGRDLPAYSGPGPELPAQPVITAPSPTFGEVHVSRSSSLTVSWSGAAADWVVVELYSHNSSGSTHVDVACAGPDTGSITIPAQYVSRSVAGGSGQLQVTRVREVMRAVSGSERVVFAGFNTFYYNAAYP